jgi:hypothetical protein
MKVYAAFVACAFIAAAAGPAKATTTLTCEGKDRLFEFNLQGAVGSDSTIGSLTVLLEPKRVRGEAGVALDSRHLVQQWIDGRELRLRFVSEADASESVEFVVSANQKSESAYLGRYRLKISRSGKVFRHSGKATCGLG